MKRKKNKKNLFFSLIILVLFCVFLVGLMMWEYGREEVEFLPHAQQAGHSQGSAEKYEPRRINILLTGRDLHGTGERDEFSSVILCSADTEAKTVALVSFSGDTWLEMPGYGSGRLNEAYTNGGIELLNETLKENFGVSVDVNIEVDFKALTDRLGGFDIDLTEWDADHLNQWHGWSLREGSNRLNGEQALAYIRIDEPESELDRPERLRSVLGALMVKYRGASLTKALGVVDAILDESASNCSDKELLGCALELYTMLNDVKVLTQQIPEEGTYSVEVVQGVRVLRMEQTENFGILGEFLS